MADLYNSKEDDGIINKINEELAVTKGDRVTLELGPKHDILKDINDILQDGNKQMYEIIEKVREKRQDYINSVSDYFQKVSINYVMKKFTNVFIYYIINFNKYKKSFFIKKLEQLVKSRNYQEYRNAVIQGDNPRTHHSVQPNAEELKKKYHELNNFFNRFVNRNIIKIEDFLNENQQLKTENGKFNNTYELIQDELEQIVAIQNKNENFKNLEPIEELLKDDKSEIETLNKLFYNYISIYLDNLKDNYDITFEEMNEKNNVSKFEDDEIFLSELYNMLIKLCNHYKSLNSNLDKVIAYDEFSRQIDKKFNEHIDSDIISYIKIRDGRDETDEEFQTFNPRYIFYSDITDDKIQKYNENLIDKSLGLNSETSNPTLSLLYCNDPSGTILIPETSKEGTKKLTVSDKTDEILVKNIQKQFREKLEINIDNIKNSDYFENKFKPIKYDHLFNFGNFNKVFYNSNNREFGSQMTEVISNLKRMNDVFIIGYGASGAGKTTTLIYDNVKQGGDAGSIVYMLKELAKSDIEKYSNLDLTITELFMDDALPKIEEIKPKALEKIKKLKFKYYQKEEKFFALKNEIKDFYDVFKSKFHEDYDKYKDQLLQEEDYKIPTTEELLVLKQKNSKTNYENPDKYDLSEMLQHLIDIKRKIDATSNNVQSSRSHVLACITINVQVDTTTKPVRLYIGDFAGVENKFDYYYNYNNNIDKTKKDIFDILTSIKIDQLLPDKRKVFQDISDNPTLNLSVTKNICTLIEIIEENDTQRKIMTDSIYTYSSLQNARPKWETLYKRYQSYQVKIDDFQVNGKPLSELNWNEGGEKYFLDNGLNYYYETGNWTDNNQYLKMLKETSEMIKFLISDRGYNEYNESGDEFSVIGEIITKIEDDDDSIFKVNIQGETREIMKLNRDLSGQDTIISEAQGKIDTIIDNEKYTTIKTLYESQVLERMNNKGIEESEFIEFCKKIDISQNPIHIIELPLINFGMYNGFDIKNKIEKPLLMSKTYAKTSGARRLTDDQKYIYFRNSIIQGAKLANFLKDYCVKKNIEIVNVNEFALPKIMRLFINNYVTQIKIKIDPTNLINNSSDKLIITLEDISLNTGHNIGEITAIKEYANGEGKNSIYNLFAQDQIKAIETAYKGTQRALTPGSTPEEKASLMTDFDDIFVYKDILNKINADNHEKNTQNAIITEARQKKEQIEEKKKYRISKK